MKINEKNHVKSSINFFFESKNSRPIDFKISSIVFHTIKKKKKPRRQRTVRKSTYVSGAESSKAANRGK
jgi:hypothetical protein